MGAVCCCCWFGDDGLQNNPSTPIPKIYQEIIKITSLIKRVLKRHQKNIS
ncbi:hypothetical protein Leryth_015746, partial [Lithospermum erythrorhizon]